MRRKWERAKKRHRKVLHPKSINLYKFIRLVLGNNIPDVHIARRWNVDPKNFHEFRYGQYPVPSLPKLEELAVVLGINKHLVFQVAGGMSAGKVFELIRKNDLPGQIRLLSKKLEQTHQSLARSEKRYRTLFNQANDAIFVVDVTSGSFIDCNGQAETISGWNRDELIGSHHTLLIPPKKKAAYKNTVKNFAAKVKTAVNNHSLYTKHGLEIPVSVSSSTLELNGRKVTHTICRVGHADG